MKFAWKLGVGGFVRVGDEVTITEGPLAGFAGRLGDLPEQRAVIVLQLGGRAIEAEMDLDWVTMKAPRRKAVSREEPDILEFRSGQK